MWNLYWLREKLSSVTDKISKTQKKAIRIITFSGFRDHTDPLFKQLEILKFRDNDEKSLKRASLSVQFVVIL